MNQPTKQQIIDAIDNATPEQMLNAMNKVLRRNNAQKFIKTLGHNFNEKQTQQLIDMLCKYEQYLEENN